MNYGELRSYFLEVLNRDDCDNNLADRFISMGIRRVERVLRTPMQRSTVTVTVDGFFPGFQVIPQDYLGMISVRVDGVELQRITNHQTSALRGYRVDGAGIYFTPELKDGQKLDIIYYGEFRDATSDEDVLPITFVIDDVVVYAALGFAATYFMDERKEQFDMDFGSLVTEVQAQVDLDILGGAILMPYGGGLA